MQFAIGIFIILHGLVHLWYVTLSQGWVEFQPAMGWRGTSWLLSSMLPGEATRWMATGLYGLAALAFTIAGVGIIAGQEWSRPWTMAAAAVSILAILLFWNGGFKMAIEKGLLGVVISIGALILVVWFS